MLELIVMVSPVALLLLVPVFILIADLVRAPAIGKRFNEECPGMTWKGQDGHRYTMNRKGRMVRV